MALYSINIIQHENVHTVADLVVRRFCVDPQSQGQKGTDRVKLKIQGFVVA